MRSFYSWGKIDAPVSALIIPKGERVQNNLPITSMCSVTFSFGELDHDRQTHYHCS
jgi:hypothetical protein